MMTNVKYILFVEDNAKDVEFTLAGLRENHLANKIVVLRDGEQALQYLRLEGDFKNRPAGNPGVMVMDLKMPKVDGIEVLRQIKSDVRLQMIPVVMLTSSREEQDLVRSYKLGVNAYVVKPVEFGEFVTAVKELGAFWAVVNEPPPDPFSSSDS